MTKYTMTWGLHASALQHSRDNQLSPALVYKLGGSSSCVEKACLVRLAPSSWISVPRYRCSKWWRYCLEQGRCPVKTLSEKMNPSLYADVLRLQRQLNLLPTCSVFESQAQVLQLQVGSAIVVIFAAGRSAAERTANM